LLQNCCVELAFKCIINRLSIIPKLISQDQTGFIKGRSASDIFIYATDITQSCYKRKVSAIVVKLDFQKALDFISWVALDRILIAKRFP
jgi:retron-type reverse transcriptase